MPGLGCCAQKKWPAGISCEGDDDAGVKSPLIQLGQRGLAGHYMLWWKCWSSFQSNLNEEGNTSATDGDPPARLPAPGTRALGFGESARPKRERLSPYPVIFGPLTVDTGAGNDERQVHFFYCIHMLGHIGMSEVDRQGALHGGSLYMDVRTRLGVCVPVTRRGQLLSVLS